MEIQFQKSPLNYLQKVVHEVQNQEQTLEVRLSDGMPDIGRILWCWGQVILREKQWNSGSMEVSGGVQAWVLYAPEDGTDPRCVESWLPFRMSWDLGNEQREGKIRVSPRLRSLDARSISARKLMVRAGLGILGEALVEDTAYLAKPEELPKDVELLRQSYPVMLDKIAGEKQFQMEEDLNLPGSVPVPEKLICYSVRPEITEQRISGNRLIFRGNGNLHILYRCDAGQLHSWDFPLPFSQLAELPSMFEDSAQGDISMAVTALELDLEEGGRMGLKCGLLGQYLVRDRQMLELVTDAYSPMRKAEPMMEELELPVQLDNRQEPFRVEQNLPQEANLVVDVGFYPDFPRQQRKDSGVELQMQGQFQTLFYNHEGVLQSAHSRWEGQLPVAMGENARLQAEPRLISSPQGDPGNGSITLKAEAVMDLQSMAEETFPMVMGIQLEPEGEKDPNRPSLILRRLGEDDLWSIAKRAGSTVYAIRRANGMEGEPKKDQILLIPIP